MLKNQVASLKKRSLRGVYEHFWDERNADIGVFLDTLIAYNPCG